MVGQYNSELKAYIADRTVNGDNEKISSEEIDFLEDLAYKLHEYVFFVSDQPKKEHFKKGPLFLGYEVPILEEKNKSIIACPLYKKDKIAAVHFDKKSLESISDITAENSYDTLCFDYNNTTVRLRYAMDWLVEKYLQNEGIGEN